jgi:hypothetical protein
MDAAKPLALIRVVGPGFVDGFPKFRIWLPSVLETKSMVRPPDNQSA